MPDAPTIRDEMVPASTLRQIYLALLHPDDGYVKRFKRVQAAAAQYEPDHPESSTVLEGELSSLIGQPIKLSDLQLQCFKEIFISEPAFAHIAPWDDLSATW
jgi:hypothetical protein